MESVVSRDGEMREGTKEMCAGVTGTTIAVENLFYNVKTRRNALKSGAEEYAKILDVVTRYASSRPDVAFSCRKVGETRATVNAPLVVLSNSGGGGSEGEREGDRVDGKKTNHLLLRRRRRRLLEKTLDFKNVDSSASAKSTVNRLKELLLFATENEQRQAGEEKMAQFHMECDILYSNANYKAKKTTFILFINGRLVECSALKRAIETAYQSVLPSSSAKNRSYF